MKNDTGKYAVVDVNGKILGLHDTIGDVWNTDYPHRSRMIAPGAEILPEPPYSPWRSTSWW